MVSSIDSTRKIQTIHEPKILVDLNAVGNRIQDEIRVHLFRVTTEQDFNKREILTDARLRPMVNSPLDVIVRSKRREASLNAKRSILKTFRCKKFLAHV